MSYIDKAFVAIGKRIASEVERRLVQGEATADDVFQAYAVRTDEELRYIRDTYTRPDTKFYEVLTQILEDRDDWEEHV